MGKMNCLFIFMDEEKERQKEPPGVERGAFTTGQVREK